MSNITRRLTAGIALLLIGLSLTLAVNLTVTRTVRAAPGVLYAAPQAVGSGNCSSWANACTLQAALAQAVSGDEIWVKAGVHYPGAAGDPEATFTLKNGVALYDGFAGTESSREQRNWQTNVTILSGDIDQNDNHGGDYINENAPQIVGNNAYHVVTGSGTDATAVLDGFVITAGQANGSYPHSYGGGMYNDYSSPTLTNVTFSGNSAENRGGGMYNYRSNPTLANVIIWGNTAPNGRGIYNGSSTPTISYSDIQGCGGSGGSWNVTCGTDGGGNIEADPRFVDAANGNVRLFSISPAVDAGNNAGCPTSDLDGLPRPTDGNGDGTATCDMGAYEAGTMLCGVNAGNDYTFSHQSGVNISVATLGNLHCLYVDEMGLNHPNATPALQTGRYWLIRGLQNDKVSDASGFTVNLTLPTAFTADASDKVCRYTGSGQMWDCAAHGYTSTSITRNGINAFSDWTVGDNAGPTTLRLTSLRVGSPFTPHGATGWLLLSVGLGVWRAKRKKR